LWSYAPDSNLPALLRILLFVAAAAFGSLGLFTDGRRESDPELSLVTVGYREIKMTGDN
jgi:hypothetical protein